MDVFEVKLTKQKKKDFTKVPKHIQINFWSWVENIELERMRSVRKVPGYHDEPLRGKRAGQRSVRLSRSYRAIYMEEMDKVLVKVLEVNKHEY